MWMGAGENGGAPINGSILSIMGVLIRVSPLPLNVQRERNFVDTRPFATLPWTALAYCLSLLAKVVVDIKNRQFFAPH